MGVLPGPIEGDEQSERLVRLVLSSCRVELLPGHGNSVCEVVEFSGLLQHLLLSVEPSRCDVWSADSEDSTPILAFVALVSSSRSSSLGCHHQNMFLLTQPLVTKWLWISN